MNRRLGRVTTGLLAALGIAAGLLVGAAPAQAATTYPVKTTLDGRTVKDPEVAVGKYRIADKYTSSVTLVCQDEGPSYGGSSIWDLTTDGLWVPDAYVKTGSSGYVLPRCAVPKSFTAKSDLNGRKNKGEAANAPGSVNNLYLKDRPVPVKCQADYQGAIWDYTTANYWVPDVYVSTGTSGYVAGLPRCDTDGIGGGPGPGFPADPRAGEAVAFARARIGATDWNNQCELFVERSVGTSGRFYSATTHYQWQRDNGRIHTGSVPPAGAVVFFTSTTVHGHVMLSIGNNSAISTGPTVYQTNSFRERSDYLGWAYMPSGW